MKKIFTLSFAILCTMYCFAQLPYMNKSFTNSGGSISSTPVGLDNINGTLYFAATDAANGKELWKSDYTAAGNVLDLHQKK